MARLLYIVYNKMPKKTRKQKMRAAQKTAVYTGPNRGVNRELSFNLQNLQQKKYEANNAKNIDKSNRSTTTSLHTPDLIKSLILGILIFGLELVIYWARK